MYSDDKIIEGIIRGDVEAYRMLFHRYYVVVMRFIWKLLKDRETAEDVAQNIFLKIWQGRNCLDSKRSIKNLLFTMAKNESINILKSTRMLTVRLEAEAESMITGWGIVQMKFLTQSSWTGRSRNVWTPCLLSAGRCS